MTDQQRANTPFTAEDRTQVEEFVTSMQQKHQQEIRTLRIRIANQQAEIAALKARLDQRAQERVDL